MNDSLPSDEMASEFDTVARWTADAAIALGRDHYVPAGCRGSGGPHTLDRLLDRLDARPGTSLLDVGAGVGGPAAYALEQRRVRPVLAEPEAGACVAARRLFGLPTVQASATALPVASASVDAVWSIGVLCTIPDQRAALREFRRVLRPHGRVGLLVYVASGELPEQPEGNTFPSMEQLNADVNAAGLHVDWDDVMTPTGEESSAWTSRMSAVDDEIERRHGDDPEWRTAQKSVATIGRLLSDGHLVGRLLVLRRSG